MTSVLIRKCGSLTCKKCYNGSHFGMNEASTRITKALMAVIVTNETVLLITA